MKVYTCLVGDLFHVGHVNFLKQAKALGDYLLVGVCSDEDCAIYKRQPIMTISERAAVIEACVYVDEIILAPPSVVTEEFLDANGIDLLVHGDESTTEQLRYFYGASIDRNAYQSIPYTHGISTSEIIQRIAARSEAELTRRHFQP
jgi:cytidyltransferase-like protein